MRPFADFLTRARAAENRVFLLTANRVGADGSVEICGLIRAEVANAEKTILPGEYEVDLFGDRRPELYGALVEESRQVHVN